MPDKKPKHARPSKRMPPQMSVPPGTVNTLLGPPGMPMGTVPMLPTRQQLAGTPPKKQMPIEAGKVPSNSAKDKRSAAQEKAAKGKGK